MKRLILGVVMLTAVQVFAQETKVPSELNEAKIELAIKDFTIAQQQFQMSQTAAQSYQQAAETARQAALARINAVRDEMKLSAAWEYNSTAKLFTKKPEPKPAAKAAAAK